MVAAPTCLEIELVSISELKPDPRNARRHSPAQIRQIADSTRAFRFNVPLLVDDDLKLLASHGRLLACQSLGYSELPVIRLGHLTRPRPSQARERRWCMGKCS